MSSGIQCQLLEMAVTKLFDIGIYVWSLTSSGAQENTESLKPLGWNLDLESKLRSKKLFCLR